MPIYHICDEKIRKLGDTTFQDQGLKERDVQNLLKHNIETIAPDTMVVAEEYGQWEDSRRRIDLLGIDKEANLVVIELKRTEDGGHMELQAIRYAAMISTLTFDQLVETYERYLNENDSEKRDAKAELLEFLEWDEPDEDRFGQEVRIVLASANFSSELTSSVMWLNEYNLDIRCVRMRPYTYEGQTLLDVQEIIPLPEAADYQIRIREKKEKEREVRKDARDRTRYDVSIAGKDYQAQAKRWTMFYLISGILRSGKDPEQIKDAIPWRKNRLFRVFDGELNSEQFRERLSEDEKKRYFTDTGQIIPLNGKTYAVSNQWGDRTAEAAASLRSAFPDLEIRFKPTETG